MTAAKKLLNVLLGKEVKQLSPATQAVYEAAIEQATFPDDAEWAVIYALRAVADQVAPEHYSCYTGHGEYDFGMDARNDAIREAILAIATELEETQ
jgi:hypothetical protein